MVWWKLGSTQRVAEARQLFHDHNDICKNRFGQYLAGWTQMSNRWGLL